LNKGGTMRPTFPQALADVRRTLNDLVSATELKTSAALDFEGALTSLRPYLEKGRIAPAAAQAFYSLDQILTELRTSGDPEEWPEVRRRASHALAALAS
jgi:hypothetical protein